MTLASLVARCLLLPGMTLLRTAERHLGGGSRTVALLLSLLNAACAVATAPLAARLLVRYPAATLPDGEGECEWIEYAGAPADRERTIFWCPGGAFITHDVHETFFALRVLPRLAACGAKPPRILRFRYPLPARKGTTAAAAEIALRTLCAGHSRVVLAGDSAGGHIALDVLLRVRERALACDGPTPPDAPCAALLAYPWLDLTHTSGAHARNASRDAMDVALVDFGAQQYLEHEQYLERERASDAADARQRASLTHTDRVSALESGSVLIVRGERDILADDGPLLAARAAAAGAAPDAVAVHTVDDGVFGVHCGALLPYADLLSAQACEAWVAMASFLSAKFADGARTTTTHSRALSRAHEHHHAPAVQPEP